ncbi:heme NO binding domain-containing protein [Roseivivax halodurans JCM 10272]|uniref:Heme NO binding domain-containing protein n=1 Tax=Roseivivax halodurans JCM 10272 TaxID=1449350 RepID=X7EFA0_9RHOB|nr:heme NO-binding domain-containing protein [Roseivivax halodurans]ETX14764.1 heme NO binding domain-containing protein [Roseivivax halodurans JCM 10272]
MHGLINRTLQVFIVDTYGAACWAVVVRRAEVAPPEFEALLRYDAELTDRLMEAIATELGRPIDAVLEDVGTYLVSHPNAQAIRRLLRFCGTDFVDFLYSLEDLPDRARLVLLDVHLPEIDVTEEREDRFVIRCRGDLPWFSHLLAGLVRAMADDYGVLAVLEHARVAGGGSLHVSIIQSDYAEERDFVLGSLGRGGRCTQ